MWCAAPSGSGEWGVRRACRTHVHGRSVVRTVSVWVSVWERSVDENVLVQPAFGRHPPFQP